MAASISTALDELEVRQKWMYEPPVNSHRPASAKSQDISHVFASTFKELYTKEVIGKDTLSNLIKTKSGRSSYHDKYVGELQQVHSEHNRQIQEADKLENHIIQARARASAQESQASERHKGDIYDDNGLLTVQSAFTWCVDNDLLEMNNLICPRNYIPAQKTPALAPPPVKVDPTKTTVSFSKHMSRDHLDDGYSLILNRTKNPLDMTGADKSMTCDSSAGIAKKRVHYKEKPAEVKPKPKWKGEPSAKDKAEAWGELQRLKDRQNFLCNPHFLPPTAQQGGMSLIQPRNKALKTLQERKDAEEQSSPDASVQIFVANPPAVVFTEYCIGQVYEMTLELKNLTSSSRNVRVIPPTTPYFSIGLGRFPGEGSVVAPGMSCKYAVRFAPDSLADYEDFIVVEAQTEHRLVVPVQGKRPPPILTLPKVLDCGYCLVGGVKFVEFLCQNVGLSPGSFTIIPKSQWPTSNLRPVARNYFSEQPPFAISPSLFMLQPGEATVVEVVFFPTAAERSSQVFCIVCDNCQVKDVAIEGEGQNIALELVPVSGEKHRPVIGDVHDMTAEHCVRFSSCNPHAEQQKKIVIRNNVHLELPFQWQVLKPNLHIRVTEETPVHSKIHSYPATDDAFHVSPATGSLAPCEDREFIFTFFPTQLRDYHSVCHLVLSDVPQPQQETSEPGGLQPVRTGSKLSDVIAMEIDVKGSTEPYKVKLEPYAIVIPGEIYICTTTRRNFKMWNHSRTFFSFQWERIDSSSHIIEVVPPAGRIEQNECVDLEIFLTGGKPEKVRTSLICHVQHHSEPVALVVEVSFKGPTVTISVPSVDFGLVQLGDETQKDLQLTNNTQLEATWTIVDTRQRQRDTQLIVTPCRGVLPPFACCSVNVFFKSHFSQQFETDLELKVENGTGCHLSVRAEVQSPQVCLLTCELLLPEVYVGVAAKGSVTLFNQTRLPAHFRWMPQLQGKHASLCSATLEPSSGTLGPNASVEITVSFTSHTNMEVKEVAALCEVQRMKSRLVLRILVPDLRTLSVTYSVPSVRSDQDAETPSNLVLDFGEDVIMKRAITKQLLVTNKTAIPAPFTIGPEYFTCPASTPQQQKEQLENRFAYVKRPLHSIQAKKVEEKAQEEFVNSLLAHGKGAAFHVLPSSGTLGPFETQTVDVTAYTDMWGEYRDDLICKVGDLEPMLIPLLMTVKGCPLYFQMTGPRDVDQTQGPSIQFGRHVSGGDTVSRSLRINNPTLTDLRVDWETYNIDLFDGKIVDLVVACGDAFPRKDADGNELAARALSLGDVQKQWPQTAAPGEISSSFESDSDEEDSSAVDDADTKQDGLSPSPAQKNLISVYIRPHLGNRSDYPFCITPQQQVIPAKGTCTIHVSFTPLTLSSSSRECKCEGLAMGFMSLDSKAAASVPGKVARAQGLDLEPFRVDLIAAVKPAALLVQMDEDDGVLDFYASAGDLLREESEKVVVRDFDVVRTAQLINTTEMVVHFKLKAPPPFLVHRTQVQSRAGTASNALSAESESLVLQQQKSMQVKLAFHCSLPLLDHMDQTDGELSPGVKLIHDVNGERRLRFQQNALIHYSNNSQQAVTLRAHLLLTTLRLSKQSIDFGFCYVGCTQTIEVNLYCCGAHTYWRSTVESHGRDPCVFSVTPDHGLLRSKELRGASCIQCFEVNFSPCEDKEFRAMVLIQSPLLKTPLTLQVQGMGSFDEAYVPE